MYIKDYKNNFYTGIKNVRVLHVRRRKANKSKKKHLIHVHGVKETAQNFGNGIYDYRTTIGEQYITIGASCPHISWEKRTQVER